MAAHEPLTAHELEILLNWLDKLRIGLWLGLRLLNKKTTRITPKFHVDQRIAKKDRVVVVQRLGPEKRLTLYGVDSPLFQIHPALFAIRINGLLLVNASSDYLLTWNFGLPHPADDWEWTTEYSPGSAEQYRCFPPHPFLGMGFGTWVFQPIVQVADMPERVVSAWTSSQWAKELGWSPSTGRCKPLIGNSKAPHPYPVEASDAWLPKQVARIPVISSFLLLEQEMLYNNYVFNMDDTMKTGEIMLKQQRAIIDLAGRNPSAFTTCVELGDTDTTDGPEL